MDNTTCQTTFTMSWYSEGFARAELCYAVQSDISTSMHVCTILGLGGGDLTFHIICNVADLVSFS